LSPGQTNLAQLESNHAERALWPHSRAVARRRVEPLQEKRARPKSEWVEYVDESLRIVSDDLIERARNRTRGRTSADERIRSGAKVKFFAVRLAALWLLRSELCDGQSIELRLRRIPGRRHMQERYFRPTCRRRGRDSRSGASRTALARALEKRKELEAALPETRQTAAVLAALPSSRSTVSAADRVRLGRRSARGLQGACDPAGPVHANIVLRPGPDRSLSLLNTRFSRLPSSG